MRVLKGQTLRGDTPKGDTPKGNIRKGNKLSDPTMHNISESDYIAYSRFSGQGPGIIFLPGHGSDMEGGKALFLEAWAKAEGRAFLRFDYRGHGLSSGSMQTTGISDWTADVVTVLDELTTGPQILVGSSLGGWLMLNAALARPNRVAGLVGIAAAPDFTEDLIWQELTDAQRQQMQRDGQIALPNPYADEDVIYPYHLIEDGRSHLRLRGGLDINVPIRLLHGMQDAEVPWQTATRIAEQAAGDDVKVHLVKDAGHRFSEESQLAMLRDVVADLFLAMDEQPR